MEQGQVAEQPNIQDRFANLLNAESEPPQEDEKPVTENQEASAEEAEKPEEEEAAAEQEEPVVEIDLDAPVVETTYKVEGGESVTEKLSIKQLQSGFMRQQDYQRKTAELARERENLQAKVKEQVDPHVHKYEHNLKVFQAAVTKVAAAEFQNVDWAKLSAEDPAEYVRLNARAQQFQQILAAAHEEVNKLDTSRQEEHQQNMAKAAQRAVEILTNDIPDWSNSLYESVLKTGVEQYGFEFSEVGNVTDPRMIKVLLDAHKYRELQKAKPNVEKRVAAVPKVIKPGPKAERSDESAQAEKDLRKRLKASGHTDDAAALFRLRMRKSP